jgi:hypothetical protein
MLSAAWVTVMLANYNFFWWPKRVEMCSNFIKRNAMFIAIKLLYMLALFIYYYFYVTFVIKIWNFVLNHGECLKESDVLYLSKIRNFIFLLSEWGIMSLYAIDDDQSRWRFWARSQNCENRLLASSCLPGCLSVCPHGTTRISLGGISWNCDIWVFFGTFVYKI